MPVQVPPLRVSRPIAACAPCRKAKSKCDQKLPVCTSCVKANKSEQCVSPLADVRETNYVTTLEAQKLALDRKMAELRSRKNSLTSVPSAARRRSTMDLEYDTHRESKGMSRRTAKKEATDIDDLVGDFGLMSISATSRDFYGFTSDTSYAKFVLAAAELAPLPAHARQNDHMPLKVTTAMMMEDYFKHVWQYLPIADQTTVWTAFNNVYGMNNPTSFDVFILRMVMAIALIATPSSNPVQARQEAVGHLTIAMSYVGAVLRPGSVGSMQALLFLIVYSIIDPTYLDWWMLLGSISRAMVDVGMHHDPPRSASMSKHELDLRRRVFWCFYSLDRVAALLLKRNFSIEEASVNVRMPSVASTPTTALSVFKLRGLQAQVFTTLYESAEVPDDIDRNQYIWELYGQLGRWKETATAGRDPDVIRVLVIEYEFTCSFLAHVALEMETPGQPGDARTRIIRDGHTARFFELVSSGAGMGLVPLLVSAMGHRTLWDVLKGT